MSGREAETAVWRAGELMNILLTKKGANKGQARKA